jgi:hypothetical protein
MAKGEKGGDRKRGKGRTKSPLGEKGGVGRKEIERLQEDPRWIYGKEKSE